ncbi:O-antigen ligase family protein [Mangrovimonas aestuarii]|uniref:O-antigen ligase family protein n=1 Tax=Mangrovimonas aestuarii TaxID=3018443 RepID=UPI0023788FF9|nr:O-antigen ligase family protein [Mangrovimonas aestuarii]
MVILRYIILAITLLNLITFSLIAFGPSAGSALSAIFLALMVVYYFFSSKNGIPIPFVVLGMLYFMLSGIQFSGIVSDYIKDAIRFFVFIITAFEVSKNTSSTEICGFLLIGALTVVLNAFLFPDDYGRYGGFYINPNTAGLVCLSGLATSFTISNRIIRILVQLIFVASGFLTLSRYYFLLLGLLYIISISIDRRNLIALGFGAIAIVVLSTFTLHLNADRFNAIKNLLGQQEGNTKALTEETRDETWVMYTNDIVNHIAFGTGYKAMQGRTENAIGFQTGVHNTYLMVLGEAGILPFLVLILTYALIFVRSLKYLKVNSEVTFMAIILVTYFMVSHNYFDSHIILFCSIWLYIQTRKEIEPALT